MKLIGVGPGRAGTRSLKSALETLGFGPCHHMEDVGARPDLAELLADAAAGAADWTAIFEGFQSMQRCFSTLAIPSGGTKVCRKPSFRASTGSPRPGRTQGPHSATALDTVPTFFGGDSQAPTQEAAADALRRHVDAVRQAVDPDRFLVYEVAQGWQPLCDFLEVPVPGEEFPRTNDAASFEERVVLTDSEPARAPGAHGL